MFKRNPSQASLSQIFDEVTQIRVFNGGMHNGRSLTSELLLELNDRPSIEALHECLAIVEDGQNRGYCMCRGDQTFELYTDQGLVAGIGLHHGRSIRWQGWKWDALLHDGERLFNWLVDQGVTSLLEERRENERLAEEWHQATIIWQEAMPKCLLPFWERMRTVSDEIHAGYKRPTNEQQVHDQLEKITNSLAQLLLALETEYPESATRIMKLFGWYGSGRGPWSGYPIYESVAERLLLTFPVNHLVKALTNHQLTANHLEGAARFFAGNAFHTYRKSESQQIPPELKRTLLKHSLESSDEDRIGRANKAFLS